MAAEQEAGMADLERELTCSICTDVFYQPLTLLDCLHTFCGSCLREWFAWQASNAALVNPYTCPSCRAPVRDTRPNATVTTLLDIFLKAHPDRGKNAQDRKEIEKAYKPGDNVVPPVQINVDSGDSEDERMLAEARELSLQDIDPERARRRAERAAQHARHRRRREAEMSRSTTLDYRPEGLGRTQQASRRAAHAQGRPPERQSSLRSILTASEPGSQEVQQQIMQQILDEGLLNGIDIDHLTAAQEEEITEMIAQAYRRRQRARSRQSLDHQHQSVAGHRQDSSPRPATPEARQEHRTHARSETTSTAQVLVPPPLSRPHLLGAVSEDDRGMRIRSTSQASQTSNRSSRHADGTLATSSQAQPVSRSATDLFEHLASQPGERRPRRSPSQDRSSTDPQGQAAAIRAYRERTASGGRSNLDRTVAPGPRSSSDSFGARTGLTNNFSGRNLASLRSSHGPSNRSSPSLATPAEPDSRNHSDGRPLTSSGAIPSPANIITPAPDISCSRCQKPAIQHSLHYYCSQCASGNCHVCLSCYRAGKGCLDWSGFGYTAKIRHERDAPPKGYPAGQNLPHILTARLYPALSSASRQDANPLELEEGLFCERCFSPAESCYWHCETCNEGAWGFCNICVQQGKHCTHPLQSLASKKSVRNRQRTDTYGAQLYPAPLDVKQPLPSSDLPNVPNPSLYTPITLPISCTICHRAVAPSHTRFHCNTCNDGDYDICAPCYHNLVATGDISPVSGPKGWRRCPRNHRMCVVGFEDREGGPRRIVVRDIVGGRALKDDTPGDANAPASGAPKWRWRESDGTPASHVSTRRQDAIVGSDRLPPDGGSGTRVLALWSYFPAEGVRDELAFPRGAEIREVEDINGDWCWGVYAGAVGLFPGNHGRVLA